MESTGTVVVILAFLAGAFVAAAFFAAFAMVG
jgi:hypothetical protein